MNTAPGVYRHVNPGELELPISQDIVKTGGLLTSISEATRIAQEDPPDRPFVNSANDVRRGTNMLVDVGDVPLTLKLLYSHLVSRYLTWTGLPAISW
eukprot:3562011-Heterocapsa_arctica.AAC.1